MGETIWCRVDTLFGVQVSFPRYGGTTVSECSAIFLGESGRPRTETPPSWAEDGASELVAIRAGQEKLKALRCSAQSSGKFFNWARRLAVSSAGWLPIRIAAMMSGAR